MIAVMNEKVFICLFFMFFVSILPELIASILENGVETAVHRHPFRGSSQP